MGGVTSSCDNYLRQVAKQNSEKKEDWSAIRQNKLATNASLSSQLHENMIAKSELISEDLFKLSPTHPGKDNIKTSLLKL
jgi:hypothetical protein